MPSAQTHRADQEDRGLLQRHCAESGIVGEKPHPSAGRAERCRFHQSQRARWSDLNRQRRKNGNPETEWNDHVTPRPRTDRGVELTGDDVAELQRSISHLASVKAYVDSSMHGRGESLTTRRITDLLNATNQLLIALDPIGRDTQNIDGRNTQAASG